MVDGHWIVVIKGVNPGNHLVSQDAESPPVDRLSMTFVQKHFGREVLGRATERVCARLAVLGKPEVGQLKVALLVN